MIAIVRTGGKQYVVRPGMTLEVEKLPGEAGSALTLSDVLLLALNDDGTGATVSTGQSVGSVAATVLEQGREKKIRVVKFKPKVRYRRIRGHRQEFTRLRVESVKAADAL